MEEVWLCVCACQRKWAAGGYSISDWNIAGSIEMNYISHTSSRYSLHLYSLIHQRVRNIVMGHRHTQLCVLLKRAFSSVSVIRGKLCNLYWWNPVLPNWSESESCLHLHDFMENVPLIWRITELAVLKYCMCLCDSPKLCKLETKQWVSCGWILCLTDLKTLRCLPSLNYKL